MYLNPVIQNKMSKEHLFRQAIQENENKIFRICRYYFTDKDDYNDAFQESLIRIWQNIDSFRNESKMSTWIFRVVANTCLSGLRRDKKRKELITSTTILENIHIPDAEPIEEDHHAEHKLEFFRRFMQHISVVDRMLVSLYLEELSTKEMAEVTGLSESNVRVKIHRIKEQIKKEWEENDNGIG